MGLLYSNTGPLLTAILFICAVSCQIYEYPPKPSLTVSPGAIRERDSVLLNCETPSSLSVSECNFDFNWKTFHTQQAPCTKTFTGTLILSLTGQQTPSEVKLQCYYKAKGFQFQSPHSDFTILAIKGLIDPDQPKLTVSPAVIKETDSVLLRCETPPHLSVSQCYIYIENHQYLPSSETTYTGTDLLAMTGQSSAAEVKMKCFYYTVGNVTPSLFSDLVSVTVLGQSPELRVHVTPENIIITCSLPGSALTDTRCNLYIREEKKYFQTQQINPQKSETKQQWFCQFFLSKDDFRPFQHEERKKMSCGYGVGPESNFLSPLSDGYSLANIMVDDSPDTTTVQTSTVTSTAATTVTSTVTSGSIATSTSTAAATVTSTVTSGSIATSTSITTLPSVTSEYPTSSMTDATSGTSDTTESSETGAPMLLVVVGVISVAVGVTLGALVAACFSWWSWKNHSKSREDQMCMKPVSSGDHVKPDDPGLYSLITSVPSVAVPSVEVPSGSSGRNARTSVNDELDTYHVYCNITEPHR